jgi:hypothetical protein
MIITISDMWKNQQKMLDNDNQKEEGLFKADAVNEEDPERDRATQV